MCISGSVQIQSIVLFFGASANQSRLFCLRAPVVRVRRSSMPYQHLLQPLHGVSSTLNTHVFACRHHKHITGVACTTHAANLTIKSSQAAWKFFIATLFHGRSAGLEWALWSPTVVTKQQCSQCLGSYGDIISSECQPVGSIHIKNSTIWNTDKKDTGLVLTANCLVYWTLINASSNHMSKTSLFFITPPARADRTGHNSSRVLRPGTVGERSLSYHLVTWHDVTSCSEAAARAACLKENAARGTGHCT